MADLAHPFGADLAFGSGADLALSSGAALAQDRVLRRLLTNTGDYLWQPDYGASLGAFVGQPVSVPRLRGAVRAQIFREPAVARQPEPVVAVSADGSGSAVLTIRYQNALVGGVQTVTVPIGGK